MASCGSIAASEAASAPKCPTIRSRWNCRLARVMLEKLGIYIVNNHVSQLMQEMADAGEDHCQAEFGSGLNNLGVTSRAARLSDCGGSGLRGQRRPIGKREERLRYQHRSLQRYAQPVSLFARSINRVNSRSRASTNRQRAILGNECDRIGFDMFANPDAEIHCAQFCLARCTLGHNAG